MTDELIIDIYWEGPFDSFEEVSEYVKKDERGQNTNYFFYQIYGEHICYGKDVLLYIGMSEKSKNESLLVDGILERLKSHHHRWTNGLCSEIKIYIGSYGQFTNWVEWKKTKYYKKPNNDNLPSIKMIESLLIYAHKPSMNCASKDCLTELKKKTFRLFNTGRRRSIMPELSTTYYTDNPEELRLLEIQKE